MSDLHTAQLSAYLDHDLTLIEHDDIERHLDSCEDCRDTLAALASVKSSVAALVGPPAPTDLWAGIASRIGTAGSTSASPVRPALVLELPRRSRAWWAAPRLWPAAAAFLVVAAGAVFALRGPVSTWFQPSRGSLISHEAGAPSGAGETRTAGFDADQLDHEVIQLQNALEAGRGKLDPKTVQVLEDNLRIIHKAIDDAKAALAEDPANRDLQDYLAGSVQRKLAFVKRAAEMAGV